MDTLEVIDLLLCAPALYSTAKVFWLRLCVFRRIPATCSDPFPPLAKGGWGGFESYFNATLCALWQIIIGTAKVEMFFHFFQIFSLFPQYTLGEKLNNSSSKLQKYLTKTKS